MDGLSVRVRTLLALLKQWRTIFLIAI
jgi:hypothetical protein